MIYDEGLDVQGAIYNAYQKGVREENERILSLLDEVFVNAPMRGDIALSDLRRLIKNSGNQK